MNVGGAGLVAAVCWIVGAGGCNLAENVEKYSYRVPAEVYSFSVPDTSRHNTIRVSMSGILGTSSASSFEAIVYLRTDTLSQFAVYAREVYDSRTRYDFVEIRFDTTLVVTVPQLPLRKQYYFQLHGANQTLQDSSIVY